MPKIKINLGGNDLTLQVPEGMDPGAYANSVSDKYQIQSQTDKEAYNPTNDMGSLDRFSAGAGRGVTNIGRNIGNIAGMISDEEMAKSKSLDQPLLDTTAGYAGNLTGEIAATLPLAAPAGLAVKGLSKASKFAGLGSKKAGSYLATPTTMAVDNALAGAIVADPNERGEGASIGGAIGAALGTTGKVLQKTIGSRWAKKSPEAMRTEKMIGDSIPLSQSGTGVAKTIYGGLVHNMPGSTSAMQKQYKNASSKMREYIAEQAMPPGVGYRDLIPEGSDAQKTMGILQEQWDDAFNNLSFKDLDMPFNQSDSWNIPKIWKDYSKANDLTDLTKIKSLTGDGLMALKRDISIAIQKLDPASYRDIPKLKAFSEEIDNLMKANIDPKGTSKGKLAEDFRFYNESLPNYNTFKDLQLASKNAASKAGDYKFEDLLKITNTRSNSMSDAVTGKGSLNTAAKNAAKALPTMNTPGVFHHLAALGATVGTLGGLATPIAAAVGGSRLAASPAVQRMIAGQNPSLRKAAKKFRKAKPKIKRALPLAGRAVTIPQVED